MLFVEVVAGEAGVANLLAARESVGDGASGDGCGLRPRSKARVALTQS